ncbi:MAG: mechanosensitive ion channel family protein [Candidatus Micrarchaeota archaeon]|nr:mechanosensitive ion channel family protein [Candidatus Micrarchaeota archaeon]
MLTEYLNYIIALSYVIGAVLLAKFFVSIVIERYLLRLTKKTRTHIDDLVVSTIRWPVYYGIIIIGLYHALKLVLPGYSSLIDLGLKAILILFGTWLLIKFSDFVIKAYALRVMGKKRIKVEEDVIALIQRLAKIFIVIIGAIIILDEAGIEVTPLLAGMGIAGLAIALALQDTLSNFFSGIYLIFDKPFKVGDRIQLNGEFGEIIDVGLRSVRIRRLDNTLVTIPNSELAKSRIVNLSAPDLRMRIKLPIGVAYGSDVQKVKKVLLKILRNTQGVLQEPEPKVRFKEFGDFSLNFEMVFWIDDIRNRWDIVDAINCKIDKEFKKAGIEIPFPVRTVYLRREK